METLHIGLGQGLGDNLADPSTGEALLDGLGVLPVEIGLVAAADVRGDGTAGEGVGGGGLRGVVLVDDGQCLQDLLDRLHTGVRTSRRLVLAPVVVDVAVLALLLRPEVLADPEDRQIDEVAPLDGGRDFHHGLAVLKGVPVVVRHRRQTDVGDPPVVEVQPEHALVIDRDAVRGRRVDPNRHHGPAQFVRTSGEHDLLRRTAQCGRAELGEGSVVEREDEVRLRLDITALVVTEGGLVERHAAAQQIFLDDGFPGHVRELLHEPFDQAGAVPVGATLLCAAAVGTAGHVRDSSVRSSKAFRVRHTVQRTTGVGRAPPHRPIRSGPAETVSGPSESRSGPEFTRASAWGG